MKDTGGRLSLVSRNLLEDIGWNDILAHMILRRGISNTLHDIQPGHPIPFLSSVLLDSHTVAFPGSDLLL